MKTFLIVLVSILCALPSLAVSAVSFVKTSTQGSCSSAATCATSFGTLPSSGNAVIVTLSCWNGSAVCAVSSVTDNQSNTYTLAACKESADSRGKACIYYSSGIGTPSGTFTVTANVAASTSTEIVAVEYSGVATASPVDVNQSNAVLTGTADTGVSATTAQNDELSVCVASVSAANTNLAFTTPSGYTQRGIQNNANATIGFHSADKILTTTGTQQCAWTHSTTSEDGWGAQLITFKAATTTKAQLRRRF